MSAGSKPTSKHPDHDRALWLQEQLRAFATHGALKKIYEQHYNNSALFEILDPAGEGESQSVLDWFLYDWFDENGKGVIEHFLETRADLSDNDRKVLADWQDSINSVFEIRSLKNDSLRLRDMDSGDEFQVNTVTALAETPYKRGQFIIARLLPLGDGFIFAGPQFLLPDRATAVEALEMVRAFDTIGSPEALEQAQREQCDAFCEVFGCPELSVPPGQLNATLERFQRYLFFERRDPQTGQTPAERLRELSGQEIKMVDLPQVPFQLEGVSEVTILCDDFDGLLVLPDYAKLKAVFAADDPAKVDPDWEDLVWNYIEDPDIPLVAFERIEEQHPDRVERVFRRLLGDPNFSIEHLYAALLHYRQQVEGMEDLKDDQRLWDAFNGNARPERRSAAKRATAKPRKPASGKSKAAPGKSRAATAKKKATAKAPLKAKAATKAAKAPGGKARATRKR